tara:strand:+ start:1953 stop:2423 length:471 start_codon:yes stop_codon:yes gene_type:complete
MSKKDMITIKVHGLKELEKSLNKLDLDLRKKASREAGRKAMEPIAKEMKSNVPVDSGKLRDTIKVSATNAPSRLKKYSKKASMIASANVGIKSKDITKTATHAIHLEYGTKNMAPQPFIRKSFNEGKKKSTIMRFRKELKKSIIKFANRQAKRKLK